MPKTKQAHPAGPGDMLEVTGHRVGDAARAGEILEVLGEAPHTHYRVRWEDGKESIVYPGNDTHVVAARRRA